MIEKVLTFYFCSKRLTTARHIRQRDTHALLRFTHFPENALATTGTEYFARLLLLPPFLRGKIPPPNLQRDDKARLISQ